MATPSGSSFRPFTRVLPVLGIAILAAPLASGCELFVHFDRSRIGGDTGAVDGGGTDGGGSDAGTDGGGMDANVDANVPDTGAVDAGVDAATPDVGNDAFHFDTGGADAGCQGISDCPPSTDECQVPTCTLGLCGLMNLDNTHVLSTGQTPNDCRQVVCNPAGGTEIIADAADHPASNACDTISCTGTTVTHVQATAGDVCAFDGGHVCDGAGACVACNLASDCTPTGVECVVATCSAHACGTMNLGTSHALTTQTPRNCQREVCNGSGGTTSVDDATDLPVSTTVCQTSPACGGSPLAPTFTDAPTGTDCTADGVAPRDVCGDTTMPAFSGTCVECNDDTDCTGPATCQPNHTCS